MESFIYTNIDFLKFLHVLRHLKYNYTILFQYLKLLKKKKEKKKRSALKLYKLLGTCMNKPPEMYFNFCYNLRYIFWFNFNF